MSRVIEDRDELRAFCEEQRGLGLRLVFTNGVFDLIHAGHLDSLKRAKAEGDLLVVAVNSDESVQRLKGKGRPILPLDQRMAVIAALEMVGAVCSFDEDTPKEIIEVVRPEVLVKGGHYEVHEIVGHEFVQSYGGKVLSLPLLEGRSTTNIVRSIQERFVSP